MTATRMSLHCKGIYGIAHALWRHYMETWRNPRVNGEFPSQRATIVGFDTFFFGNETNIRIAGDLRGRGACYVPVIEKPLLTYHSLDPLAIDILTSAMLF